MATASATSGAIFPTRWPRPRAISRCRAGRPGETWGYEVALPKGFNPKRVNENTLKPLGEWQKVGIVRVTGEALSAADRQGLAVRAGRDCADRPSSCSIISARSSATTWRSPTRSPSGTSPTGSGAGGRFVHPWPTDETHLSLEQRTEFQRLLIAQGLMTGEPDGVIGPGDARSGQDLSAVEGTWGGRIPKPHAAQAVTERAAAPGCRASSTRHRERGTACRRDPRTTGQ